MNLINFTIVILSGITLVVSEFDFDESREIYWQNYTPFDELYWDIVPAPNGKLIFIVCISIQKVVGYGNKGASF